MVAESSFQFNPDVRKGLSQGRLATAAWCGAAMQGHLCKGNGEPRSEGTLLFPFSVLSLLVCELQQ